MDGPTRRAAEAAGETVTATPTPSVQEIYGGTIQEAYARKRAAEAAETVAREVAERNLPWMILAGIVLDVLILILLTCITVTVFDRVLDKQLSKLTCFTVVSNVSSFVITVFLMIYWCVRFGLDLFTATGLFVNYAHWANEAIILSIWSISGVLGFVSVIACIIRNLCVAINTFMKSMSMDDVMVLRPAKMGFRFTLIGTFCIIFFYIPVWFPLLLIGHKFTKQARGMMACKKPTLTRVGNLGG